MGRERVIMVVVALASGCGLDVVGTALDGGASPIDASSGEASAEASDDANFDLDAGDSATGTCDADLANDPSSCGACGHGCGGGACEGGTCGTFDLVTLSNTARSVYAGATELYWSLELAGKIGTVQFDGGNPKTIMNSVTSPAQVAVDATNLYYVNRNASELHRVSLDGTGDQLMSANLVGCAFPSGGAVYATNYGASTGAKVDIATFQKTALISSTNGVVTPWGIGVTATDLYWTNAGGGGTSIWRLPLASAGTNVTGTKIIDSQSNPNCLSFEGPYMYWANFLDGSIRRSKLDGTGIVTLEAAQTQPTGVAIGPKFLYWVSGDKIRALAK